MRAIALFAGSTFLFNPIPGAAGGDLEARPIDLPELGLNGDLAMSQTEYLPETSQFYRIHISSNGGEAFARVSPKLFRRSWVDRYENRDLKGVFRVN
jgi:hypothetical protein